MADIKEIYEVNLWENGVRCVSNLETDEVSFIPIEYDWLIKGDPEPFIAALEAEPKRYNYQWVKEVLHLALRGELKRPRGQPRTKLTGSRHRKAIMIILQQMTRGQSQTDACRTAAEMVFLSYDQVYKGILKQFPNGIGLAGLWVEMIEDNYIEPGEAEKLSRTIDSLIIGD